MNTAVPSTEVVGARGDKAMPGQVTQTRPRCRAAEPAVPTRLPERLPTGTASSAQVRRTAGLGYL